MFFALFLSLLLLNGIVGVCMWFALQRISTHMRNNPEAAELVAKHVIAPLLTGKTENPEVKKTRGGMLV